MQIEEAKDAISKLIRDSIPADQAQRGQQQPGGVINFFGGTNVVQIHVLPARNHPLAPPRADAADHDDEHPAITIRRRGVILSSILNADQELGGKGYHLRFIRSIFGRADLHSLDIAQLKQVLSWMTNEIEARVRNRPVT